MNQTSDNSSVTDNTNKPSPQMRSVSIGLVALLAIGAMLGMGLLMYRMVVAVENMSHDVHKMSILMNDIDKNIDEMDNNILLMNSNIHDIQKVISRDIRKMSINMQSMNSSILIIRDDIHYSAGSFSSPQRYMKNMFANPR